MATESSSATPTTDQLDRDEQDTKPVEADTPIVTSDMLMAGDPPTGWFGKKCRRFENWLTEKSTEFNRWHRFLAWVFLSLAYRSGIRPGRANAFVGAGFTYRVVIMTSLGRDNCAMQ